MDHLHSIRIVPSWDCYVMSYHPRELFVPQAYRNRIFRKLEGNAPVILVDGVAAGVWEKQQKKSQTQVLIKPFKPLTPDQTRTVEEEVGLLGEFLGTKV